MKHFQKQIFLTMYMTAFATSNFNDHFSFYWTFPQAYLTLTHLSCIEIHGLDTDLPTSWSS